MKRAFLLLVFLSASLHAEVPQILKVEPPEWWAGHSVNPVRVLVRGKGLEGATVESSGPDLRAGAFLVNAAGTTLFFDLWIGAHAAPGPRTLRVRTRGGEAGLPFVVESPVPRAGRFQGFSSEDVFYLIMPDRFANGDPGNDDPTRSKGLTDRTKARYYHGGDLQGIVEHLPYLKDLGVTTLWLTPLYDNADHLNEKQKVDGLAIADYHGYGATDLYAVEEHFGDVPMLRTLVDRAHALGLKVVLDQVANHVGPDHPWALDPPTPTWLHGSALSHLENHWQVWTIADPHSTEALRRETLDGWFVNVLPDLNQDDPEVSRYLIQNTLWWAGISGIDGIRQDTVPYVPRTFWKEWRAALRKEYPSLSVLGEVSNSDPTLVAFFQGGAARFDGIDSGIESLFDYPLYYAVEHAFGEGHALREVPETLGHDRLYTNAQNLVTFAGLHDNPRFMGLKGATPDGLRLALTFLATTRGIPLVYYGDEIGMPGGEDPDNRRDFPGGFPGDSRSAFTNEGRTPVERSIFDHLRKLLHLRAELPALRTGSLQQVMAEEQGYVFARSSGDQTVLVALNNDSRPAHLEFSTREAGLREGRRFEDRLGALPPLVLGARTRIDLPARSGAIFVSTGDGPSKGR